jgi:hypothetical protein
MWRIRMLPDDFPQSLVTKMGHYCHKLFQHCKLALSSRVRSCSVFTGGPQPTAKDAQRAGID